MPAEWSAHASTWIAWPHNAEDWPNKFQPIPWVYCEIVRHLSREEDVHILVNDLATERRATSMLRRQGANLARLHFHLWRTDRVWLRDSGPIFVKGAGGTVAVTDWKFNAWAKYENYRNDDRIPQHVAELYGMERWAPTVMLPEWERNSGWCSGGWVDRYQRSGRAADYRGVSAESEVQQRNPGVSKDAARAGVCASTSGFEKVIWLESRMRGR